MNWDNIKAAWELVEEGGVTKVEGLGWKVYRVGDIIRIDTEGGR